MTRTEATKAERLLRPLTDRTETIALDTGGVAITAVWKHGGQTLFYRLDRVQECVAELERASRSHEIAHA